MAARPRWATGVCLALLAACGGGEPATAPDGAVPAAPQAVVPVGTPQPATADAATPDAAVTPPDPPQARDPEAEADLASTESVAGRVDRWLDSGSPQQAARALRLLANLRGRGGESDDALELAELADRARAQSIEWATLGFAHGSIAPAQAVLPALQLWDGADPEVVALAARLAQARRIDSLLMQADVLRSQGRRLAPEDSALAKLQEARRLDPGHPRTRLALESLQGELLDEAVAAAQREAFSEAEERLVEASRVIPGTAAVQDSAARVTEMRERAIARWRTRIAGALAAGDAATATGLLAGLESVSQDERDMAWARAGIERVRLYGMHAPGRLLVDPLADGGSGPGMVVIPAGGFQMGSPRSESNRPAAEAPRHQVGFARGFALARTETTVAQFRAFVEATGYRSSAEKAKRSTVYDERSGALIEKRGVTWRDDYVGHPASGDQPVMHVSWSDAAAYAAWLAAQTGHGYRLPSEAEVEYALRAGSTSRYPWGDDGPPPGVENLTGARDVSSSGRRWSNAFAGYGDGFWGPAPVASFAVNAFGLSDMNGNLSEWVADCWHESYARAPRDGSAWVNPGCRERVIRGASWASAPDQARSAFRLRAPTATTSARVGFRVARELFDASE